MPRRIFVPTDSIETFGQRLARIRKAAGFSQRDLAKELGISQRMVAYYEKETDQPPSALLPLIATTLRVSTDELLGLRVGSQANLKASKNTKLWRRFKQLEKLPPREQRKIVDVLDALIDRASQSKEASA